MAQFKVGDRVRVLRSHGSPMKPGDFGTVVTADDQRRLRVLSELPTGGDDIWLFPSGLVELATFASTDAQKVRDAIEVAKGADEYDGPTLLRRDHAVSYLVGLAARLEAASAPKPPSLREAAAEYMRAVETAPGSLAHELAAGRLRRALSREEA